MTVSRDIRAWQTLSDISNSAKEEEVPPLARKHVGRGAEIWE